jgi:hypothetical protein
MTDGRMTPVQLAKQMGIRPQGIYGLIKQGKVKNYAPEGKTAIVDEDEVKSALVKSASRTAKTGKGKTGGGGNSSAPKGTVVAWKATPTKIRVGKVSAVDDILTYIKTTDGDTLPFTNESLTERIAKGQIVLPRLHTLLDLIISESDKSDQEDAMRYCIDGIKRLQALDRRGDSVLTRLGGDKVAD